MKYALIWESQCNMHVLEALEGTMGCSPADRGLRSSVGSYELTGATDCKHRGGKG